VDLAPCSGVSGGRWQWDVTWQLKANDNGFFCFTTQARGAGEKSPRVCMREWRKRREALAEFDGRRCLTTK
jgi:hypothetical protein